MTEGTQPAWDMFLTSWKLAMQADGYPPTTIKSYRGGVGDLAAWMAKNTDHGPTEINRDDIRGWMVDLGARTSRATVRTRLAGARHFCAFLVDEREISEDPSRAVRMPPPGEPVTPVLSMEDLAALLKACAAPGGFVGRRDEAMVRLFLDGGARLAEITGLDVDDVDVTSRVAYIEGKGYSRRGARKRVMVYGTKTARALDRYLRARRSHPQADLPALWLGARGRGAMTKYGVKAMLDRRSAEAGLDVHPHMLRHAWAHHFRMNGGSEGDLQVLGGWRTRQQLDRYGASAAGERAAEAARRHSLGDRL